MLSNFQMGGRALLQSFLIGQPELRRILQGPDMQQFRQRHFKWFPVCLQAAVINLAAERIAASSGCGEAAVSR